MRRLASVGTKLLLLAAVIYLGTFYLRLGFFLPLLILLGAIVALALTSSEWRQAQIKYIAAAGVVAAYLIVQTLMFRVTAHSSNERHTMLWSVEGDESGGSYVILEFESHPGQVVAISSEELRTHLESLDRRTVDVVLEVSRDIGCMSGFNTVRIADLEGWQADGPGYAGSRGADSSPWSDPWWCR